MNIDAKKKLLPYCAYLAVLVVVLWFLLPLFAHPNALINDDPFRYHDYLQQASYDYLFRDSLLNHGQFAWRTYMLGGGYPLVANPQDTSFSPFALVPLIFGVPVGMKINITLFFLIGAAGMMMLVRKGLGLPMSGAAFAALAYCFSAWWASRIEWGFYFKLYFHLVPFVLYFYLKARKKPLALLWAAMLLTVIITQLGLGFVVIFLFLFFLELLDYLAGWKKSRRPAFLGRLVLLGLLVLCLGAVRIFPMVKLVQQNPREIGGYETYAASTHGNPDFYKSPSLFFYALTHYDTTPNFPIHPGWGVLLLAVVGVVVRFRKSWRFAALTILFSIFAFGPFSPVDLWRPIFYLPFFSSMHQPYQLTNYFILLGIVLCAAYAFSLIEPLRDRYALLTLLCLMPFLFLIQPIKDNRRIYEKVFTKAAPRLPAEKDFFTIKGRNQNRGAPRTLHSHQYFNLLRGVGTIDWDGDLNLEENAIPRQWVDNEDNIADNPDYKGEIWVDGSGGQASLTKLSPNEIRFKAETADWVVINQNYDSRWKLKAGCGELSSRQGLLAVHPCSNSEQRFTLVYRPKEIYAGLVISLISWIGALTFAFRKKTRLRFG